MKFILLFFTGFIFSSMLFGQITQTIRGTVLDELSEEPMIGVTIQIINSDSLIGTVTDIYGEFALRKIRVGRIDLKLSFVGYEDILLANLELVSGKELVLNIKMNELINELKGVEITANGEGEVLNKMATNSAISFSVEEASRYAGSLGDVSRMAQNFAGVQGADDSRNDIVIRGNSPSGVLYRVGGLDMPNPNHFARFGTSGGPISMLNTNVMSKSDFFTGAFPSQYGNALAGVFDIHLRNGNNQKYEGLLQIGFNGIEAMTEGPFSKKSKASFLINYRLSTLGLFQLMGLNFGTTALPKYQDLSFKINIPSKRGVTSIFGIGGISKINFIAKDLAEANELYTEGGENLHFTSNSGVVGVSHKQRLNKSDFIEVIVGVQAATNGIIVDTVDVNFENPFRTYNNNSVIGKQTTSVHYSNKISSKHFIKAGVYFDWIFFSLKDSVYQEQLNSYINLRNIDGSTFLVQPYFQYQFRPTNRITFNFGLHYQQLLLSNQFNVEPRIGASFMLNEINRLSFSYGYHSQIAPAELYFLESSDGMGNTILSNKNVDFTKSNHFVIGYELFLKWGMHIKLEAYYQYILGALVERKSSSYSLLNAGAAFDEGYRDSLVNDGRGYNYGLELTVEKRMQNGIYFLVNSSFFNSKYKASDGVWRNTAFNGNYTVNVLGGYELRFKQKKEFNKKGKPIPKFTMTFDTKFVVNGGARYSDVLLDESIAAGTEVRDDANAFANQFPAYFKWNLRVGFKMIGKRVTQEWAVDFQNVTNQKNIFNYQYNSSSQEIQTIYQTGFLPIVLYRLMF